VLEKFPAKGEILKVEKQALDLDYVLTNEQGKYKIYLVNEKNLTLSKVKEAYADGTPFGKIEDIWKYGGIGTREYIGVFHKDKIYPIKMIDITNFY